MGNTIVGCLKRILNGLNPSASVPANGSICDYLHPLGDAVGNIPRLNESGKIPEEMLPSYVDDVIEGYLDDDNHFWKDSEHTEEIEGESGKIYVDLPTGETFRFSGSVFVRINDVDPFYENETAGTTINMIAGQAYAVTGTPTAITATLTGVKSGIENQWRLKFVAGENFGLTLNVPEGTTLVWKDGEAPTFTAGNLYEIDAVKNFNKICVIVTEWSV